MKLEGEEVEENQATHSFPLECEQQIVVGVVVGEIYEWMWIEVEQVEG